MGGFYCFLFVYYFLTLLLNLEADLKGGSEARRHELLV